MPLTQAKVMQIAQEFLNGDISPLHIRTSAEFGHQGRAVVALTTMLSMGWTNFSTKTTSASRLITSLFPCVHSNGDYCTDHTHCAPNAGSRRGLCSGLVVDRVMHHLRSGSLIASQGTKGAPGGPMSLTLTPSDALRQLVEAFGTEPNTVQAFLAGRRYQVTTGMTRDEAIEAEAALSVKDRGLTCTFA